MINSFLSSYLIILVFLLFVSNIVTLINFKNTCDLLKFPYGCHCQQRHGLIRLSLNETRLRCRQLTNITTDYRWSIASYDRLIFETFNDNLTLHRFALADIRARTLRFNVQNLILNDHAFDNTYIGQLVMSYRDNYGQINFEFNGQIFYGTTITNMIFKSINFQTKISEIIFSNAKIYKFLIQSSKFYGFTNEINSKNEIKMKNTNQYNYIHTYNNLMSTMNLTINQSLLKIHRMKTKKILRRTILDENSSLPDKTVIIKITAVHRPVFITIYTILSSINTTNLTENYFPNNLEYYQTIEIELNHNYIKSIDAHVFRHLQFFQGRLLLTNNHIQYISPYAFTDLHLLTNLSLANNNIQNLSSIHFEKLKNLYELDLSFNHIYELNNDIFQYLSNLHILYLNHNRLKFIDSNVFTNLIYLKEINLQNIPLIHIIDPKYSHWIWNLANLHVNNLLNTDFDLSDVAFCLLTHFNQTFFHLSRQHSCGCNVHYLYYNPDIFQSSTINYHTNYLRLTPICLLNETISIFQRYQNENEQIQYFNMTDFILRSLDDKCDYKFMFLDCDAMTTTTTITDMVTISEMISDSKINNYTISISTVTPWYFKYTKAPKTSINNIQKLFTILSILIIITIVAVIIVILWYRLDAMYKRKKQNQRTVEKEKNSDLLSNNRHHHHSTASHYASTDVLGNIQSAQLTRHKSQSEECMAPASSPPAVHKDIDASINDTVQSYIDEESQSQHVTNNQTTEINKTTQY